MCSTSKSTTQSAGVNYFEPWVRDSGLNIYAGASNYAANNPYQAYSGPTAADANPAQTAAMGYLGSQLGQTNPYTTQAAGDISSVAGSINPNASIQSLMSPYAQAALAPTLQQIHDTADQQRQAAGTGAAMNGAFGGSAQGVAQGLADRYEQQNVGNATAQGMNQAFTAAQGQQNTNLQNLLSAGNSLSNVGQNAFGQGTTLASLLGSLGGQQQNIQQQGISNAMTVNQQKNTGQLGQYATLASILGAVPKNSMSWGNQETTQPDNTGLSLLGSLL